MHSCDPLPPPPATGPSLLQELGRLIIRARSRSPSRQPRAAPADARERLLKAKLLAAKSLLPQPSTSQQVVQQQPRAEPGSPVEAQLDTHVHALWHEQIPICIEVQLAPDCPECFAKLSKMEEQSFDKAYDKSPKSSQERRGLLLERWTMTVVMKKTHEPSPHLISSQWLLSAVRSQLHFSQLGAWLARLKPKTEARHRGEEARHRGEDPGERRRKLSRESCNIKKLEANGAAEHCACAPPRRLNVLYSIGAPAERSQPPFDRAPAVHAFPNTDIGNNVHLCVVLESLPRTAEIPTLACLCAPKRRTSKDMSTSAHEDLASRIHDLTLGTSDGHRSHFTNDLGIINSNIGSSSGVTRRLSIFNNQENQDYPKTKENEATANETVLVDDRMHTLCSESGKHKCNCDDESSDQGKENPSSSKHHQQETKKLDERRLKEIAKYKRRLRKESKLRKLRDSTSESTGTSEGDGLNAKLKETHTSIPILQASRFDRFRAIGCYRNQTYLTLPASRIETKSPFLQEIIHPVEFTKTNTVSTQTEDISCDCGSKVFIKCDECKRGMKRSEANYNLTALNENEATKKPKCDNIINNNNILNINNKTCDINNLVVKEAKTSGIRKTPDDDEQTNIIKRPKLKKFLPLTDRIEKIVTDRKQSRQTDNDIEELLLKDDDSVFEYLSKNNQRQNPERQRQKNSSIGDDYVLYEKCYYGTFDRYDAESPKETTNGFVYPNDSKNHRTENPEFQFQNPGFVSPNAQNHSSEKNGFQFPKPGYVYQKDSQNGHSEKPGFQFPTPEYDSQNHRSEKPGFQFPTPPPDAVSLDLKLQDYQSDSCTPNTPTYPDSENGFQYPNTQKDSQIPSPTEMDRFRWRFDSAASMVFHTKTGLPLTSSPAPLKRGNNCFDYDDSINGISGIKSALFHRHSPRAECASPAPPPPPRASAAHRPNVGPSASLLGSFEESALKGRLEPVATVHGFTAELGASGAFCPPHRRLPVTVFFYAPGGTNAPYMGHINLGTHGYRVARSGTIQVSLFNPHGTLVKMFVVLYDLTAMPAAARTFLRQRTLYLPAGCKEPPAKEHHKYMRYLIHLRFMTSKSGKLYLHTDIRIIVSRKADMDTATAHSAIFNSISTNNNKAPSAPANHSAEKTEGKDESANRKPCRVFGGCSDFKDFELGYENQTGVSYELRSFTYGPENPKYSPR